MPLSKQRNAKTGKVYALGIALFFLELIPPHKQAAAVEYNCMTRQAYAWKKGKLEAVSISKNSGMRFNSDTGDLWNPLPSGIKLSVVQQPDANNDLIAVYDPNGKHKMNMILHIRAWDSEAETSFLLLDDGGIASGACDKTK
ncbi:MAG: hypothetical protein PHW76_03315 [Alphaproteobacteria bacterium]|nr:hypothetical protein [Alphaproteobacteria bacterium]